MGLALQQDLLPEEQKVKWSMHFGLPEEELEELEEIPPLEEEETQIKNSGLQSRLPPPIGLQQSAKPFMH